MSPGTVLGPIVAVDDLRRAFLDLPQPVAVVTGLSPSGEAVGMTVSSLTSVSLAPLLVLFCPTVTSRAWAAARERGSFAVNILGHRQGELAVRFAGPGDRFIVIGEPTIEKGLDKALTKAAKVVKRTVDATTDEITSELQEALKAE